MTDFMNLAQNAPIVESSKLFSRKQGCKTRSDEKPPFEDDEPYRLEKPSDDIPKKKKKTGIRRVIKATDSSRQMMRQISGLGMGDPVFASDRDEIATPFHPSQIFDDMDVSAIPDDMREVVSCCSDHTASEKNGIDIEKFHQSMGTLQISGHSSMFASESKLHRSKPEKRHAVKNRSKRSGKNPGGSCHEAWHSSVTTFTDFSQASPSAEPSTGMLIQPSDHKVAEDEKETLLFSYSIGEAQKQPSSSSRMTSAVVKKRQDSTTRTGNRSTLSTVPRASTNSKKKSRGKEICEFPAHQKPKTQAFKSDEAGSPARTGKDIAIFNGNLASPAKRQLPFCPSDIFGTDSRKGTVAAMKSPERRCLPTSPEKLFETFQKEKNCLPPTSGLVSPTVSRSPQNKVATAHPSEKYCAPKLPYIPTHY